MPGVVADERALGVLGQQEGFDVLALSRDMMLHSETC